MPENGSTKLALFQRASHLILVKFRVGLFKVLIGVAQIA